MNLDELAIQAKTDQDAFAQLLKQVKPICRFVANRYKGVVGYDEVMQWARIEVWNAVRLFRVDGGMKFRGFCSITVFNHVKSRLRRYYGPENMIHKDALRLDAPIGDDEGKDYAEVIVDRTIDIETQVIRSESLIVIRKILNNTPFTQLEKDCLHLFYGLNMSHVAIQKQLNLSSRKTVDNALQRVRRKLAKDERLREEYQSLMEVSA